MGVEDLVVMEDILVVMEDIPVATVGITMATEDIMVVITMEVSTLADTLGSPTIILTVIILTPTRLLITQEL